jgi:hypothetical protein
MKTFYTYLHCKPDLTPFYVGKGTLKRCYEIKRSRNQHHQNIVAKYGQENIHVIVFKKDSEESAFKSEIRLIKMLRNAGFELCNKTDGGEGSSGCKFPPKSPEWCANHSAKMKGRKASAETKAKMSVAQTGRKMPPDFGPSVSLRNLGNKYALGNKVNLGRKQSAETIEKRVSKLKGQKRTDEVRAKMLGNQYARKAIIV